MATNSPKRSDSQPEETSTERVDSEGSPAPVGLLILASIVLVCALLAGTLLLSRPSNASAPGQPKVVTVTASAPESKSYPTYSPTGPRYTAQPISMSPVSEQTWAPPVEHSEAPKPAEQTSAAEREVVTQEPRPEAERAPQTQAPQEPEPQPRQTAVVIQTLS